MSGQHEPGSLTSSSQHAGRCYLHPLLKQIVAGRFWEYLLLEKQHVIWPTSNPSTPAVQHMATPKRDELATVSDTGLLLLQEKSYQLHCIHGKQALTCMTPMANRPWDDILLGFSAFPLPPGAPAAAAHQAYLNCTAMPTGTMVAVSFQPSEMGAAPQ